MTETSVSADVIRSKEGDTAAFARVVQATQEGAFQIAFRLLCDEDEAKDMVQESFIRAWSNLSRFDVAKTFTTWLHKIVTNACLDELRARHRGFQRFTSVNVTAAADAASADRSMADRTSNEDLARVIRKLTGKLPPRQKVVFTLRDLQDLPVEEVAAITGLSPDTIKANLYYARRTIRRYLESVYDVTGA